MIAQLLLLEKVLLTWHLELPGMPFRGLSYDDLGSMSRDLAAAWQPGNTAILGVDLEEGLSDTSVLRVLQPSSSG